MIFPDKNDPNVNVNNLLSIDENNLEQDLASCASLYYTFSEYALEAENIYNDAVSAIEHHELELANRFRSEFQPKKSADKLNEADIKRMFRGDDKWNLLKKEVNKCYVNFKKMEKAAKAFEMKSTNCQSINKRQLKLERD